MHPCDQKFEQSLQLGSKKETETQAYEVDY